LKDIHALEDYVLPGKTLLNSFSESTKETRRVEFVKFLRIITNIDPLPRKVIKFLKIPKFDKEGPLSNMITPTTPIAENESEAAVDTSTPKPKKGSMVPAIIVLTVYLLVYFRIVNIDINEISPCKYSNQPYIV
jgi:hypothetical protein